MTDLNDKLMAIAAEKRQPLEVECYDFLISEGIKFPPYHYATNQEEMDIIIEKMNPDGKYVFKVMSPKILHKSDFQAVLLNITPSEAKNTFSELKEKFEPLDFRGVLIVPMATDGVELLLGSTIDPTFGLITVFGIGGTMVEILKDVTFGKTPLTRQDARLMLKSVKNQEMFNGPRGLPKLSINEMIELLVKFSQITEKYKSIIKEIDLNPLRVTTNGIYALDARVIFHPETC